MRSCLLEIRACVCVSVCTAVYMICVHHKPVQVVFLSSYPGLSPSVAVPQSTVAHIHNAEEEDRSSQEG